MAPPTTPRLLTCSSNDLYGGSAVLRAYCSVQEQLPIVGRIQHGWEPGPGVVVDAMSDAAFDRYYVWSALAHERLDKLRVHAAAGLNRNTITSRNLETVNPNVKLIPIGAPYLYLTEVEDPGPIGPDWLLAVPGHGIVASPTRARPWEDYLSAVGEFAKAKCFGRVTVLLYAEDDSDDARRAILESGFVPATCGNVGHPGYLLRVRDFVRQHAAVTSDRVCTAGMYALYENRPFHVVGAGTVVHEPPDAYADLVADLCWIEKNYPGIRAGGLAGREEARCELGVKLDPMTLRRLLYYWVWEGP